MGKDRWKGDRRTAQEVMDEEIKGKIKGEFPGEFLDMAVEDIEKLAQRGNAKARTALKLLGDKRFRKPR